MKAPRSVGGSSSARLTIGSCMLALTSACGGTLDAGADRAQDPLLPVTANSPVILSNDGASDNWFGEYALLLAKARQLTIAGLVVSAGGSWPDLDANLSGWQALLERARESGLEGIPDPVRSDTQPLTRPADDAIDSTVPNASEGARFIVETSLELGRPERPVVVVTGGRLTDVADAYLLDPEVTERVIVVSSLGTGFGNGEVARMGIPNGEMDPWAAAIVVQRFRYVQASAYYNQQADVPAERFADLPDNPFGAWIRSKQPDVFDIAVASDQVSVLAVALPAFTKQATRASFAGWSAMEPTLARDPDGQAWIVTESDGAAATARFWQILLDPATFAR
jgi:hypothetical protein